MSTVTYSARPASLAANRANASRHPACVDRTRPRLVGGPPAIRPRMDLQPPRTHVAVVAGQAVPAPALEVAAPPDGNPLHRRQVERAVDPAPAAPFRRTDVPVGMVVEGHERQRLPAAEPHRPPHPEGAEMVEVARAVHDEARLRRQQPGAGGVERLHLGVGARKNAGAVPTSGSPARGAAAIPPAKLRRGPRARCGSMGT